MSAKPVAVKLLSALRKAQSKAALYETPAAFFEEGEERDAFDWLKDHVATYNAFPTPTTFLNETGIQTVTTNEPVKFYQNEARKRALWQMQITPIGAMRTAMEKKDPDAVLQLCKEMLQASQELNAKREGLITLSDSMDMVEADYFEARNAIGLRGIPTPYEFLNEITDGWQNSDVITIVARPGMGKTMFLLYMAWAAWKAGYVVLFLSMEMGTIQLARRLFGMEMGIDPTFIRKGNLSSQSQREMQRQMGLVRANTTPFYWLAGNFKKTVPALRAAAYETEADIIFADASYLLKPEASKGTKFGSRRESIAEVVEEIGALCKELNRPIIQSVQFNRQATKPKKGEDEVDRSNPVAHLTLEKIGETDVVGQVSSVVFGLERGESPNQNTERYLGLLKGREGEQGWMKVNYRFRPFDMSEITNSTRFRPNEDAAAVEAPDLSYMDAAA